MKKKILLSGLIAIIFAVSGYNVYLSKKKVQLVDLIMSNYEALASDAEVGTGRYTVYTYQCPPPIQYKTSVSCQSGGHDECYPSDC